MSALKEANGAQCVKDADGPNSDLDRLRPPHQQTREKERTGTIKVAPV